MPPSAADLAPYADFVLQGCRRSRNCRTTTAARCGRTTTCPDGRRILIATDRLSAFDRILTAIP